jgi:hypothetical protein
MSYIFGQASVPANSTVGTLFIIPPGPCNVTFYNLSTNTVWVGTNAAQLSTVSGMVCHSIPTNIFGYMSSRGVTVYGLNTASSVVQVQYAIATDQ